MTNRLSRLQPVWRLLGWTAAVFLLGNWASDMGLAQSGLPETVLPQMKKAVYRLVESAKTELTEADELVFSVSGFRSLNPDQTVGPALNQALRQAIGDPSLSQKVGLKMSVTTSRTAKLSLSGKYSAPFIHRTTMGACVTISLDLFTRDLRRIGSTQELITDTTAVLAMSGGNADLQKVTQEVAEETTDQTTQVAQQILHRKLSQAVVQAYEQPAFITEHQKTIIRASSTSPYGMEILKRRPGQADYEVCQIQDRQGHPYVTFQEGDVYAIRLRNHDKDYDAAVTVTIDGLSHFTFCDPKFKSGGVPQLSYLVVPRASSPDRPGQSLVSGWWKNFHEHEEFEVAQLQKAAAHEIGRPGKIGTISVRFSRAWSEGQSEPPPQPGSKGRNIGTRRGRSVPSESSLVERYVGEPQAFLSIRYERPSTESAPVQP